LELLALFTLLYEKNNIEDPGYYQPGKTDVGGSGPQNPKGERSF
jgi:hypothetical protein